MTQTVNAQWYAVPVQGTVDGTMEQVYVSLVSQNHVVRRWALAPLTRLRLHHELTGGRGDAVSLVRIRGVPVERVNTAAWSAENRVYYVPVTMVDVEAQGHA